LERVLGVWKPPPFRLPLFTGVRGKKTNSRKFTVASNPSGATLSTRQRHGGTLQAAKRGDLVLFVAPTCIKGLRLVTVRLPENSQPIGPGFNRTSR
jgi:hypothetical protein